VIATNADGTVIHADSIGLRFMSGTATVIKDAPEALREELLRTLKWLAFHGRPRKPEEQEQPPDPSTVAANTTDSGVTHKEEKMDREKALRYAEAVNQAAAAQQHNQKMFAEYRASVAAGNEDTSSLENVDLQQLNMLLDAWGVLPQEPPPCEGVTKLFWAYRPRTGPHAADGVRDPIWDWIRRCYPHDSYARKLCGDDVNWGELPEAVAFSGGLPWPTASQWAMLRTEYGIPTHFHELFPGDAYFIRRGTLHLVLNSDGFSISFAGDTSRDCITWLNALRPGAWV
jgi:hypothetical protein